MPHMQMNTLGRLEGYTGAAEELLRDALRKVQAGTVDPDEQSVEDDLEVTLRWLGHVRRALQERMR